MTRRPRATQTDRPRREIRKWKEAVPVVFPKGVIDDELNLSRGQIIHLKYLSYDSYIKSRHWKIIRDQLISLSERVCQGCAHRIPNDKGIWVHHISYDHRGEERYEDLEVLCYRCHRKRHADVKWASRKSPTSSLPSSGISADKSVVREPAPLLSYGPTAT